MARALQLTEAEGLLITAGVVLLVAGTIATIAAFSLKRSVTPLRRSAEEFTRNVNWLRTVLLHSGRPAQNGAIEPRPSLELLTFRRFKSDTARKSRLDTRKHEPKAQARGVGQDPFLALGSCFRLAGPRFPAHVSTGRPDRSTQENRTWNTLPGGRQARVVRFMSF